VRKRIVSSGRIDAKSGLDATWMNLEQIAAVEVSSEDPDFPIESALNADGGPGWRASGKGEHHIRLVFDRPQAVRRIQLQFVEQTRNRLQEFTIRWSASDVGEAKEIIRQQWNFSPGGSTSEFEDYRVNLDDVRVLELEIKPDLPDNEILATLAAWRVA
jgi:hypothetical protein